MGRTLRIAAGIIGAVAFGIGAWPLGAVCFLYLVVVLWPRRFPRLLARHVVATVMFFLSATALASGGTFSPFVFLVAGLLLLSWPALLRGLRLDVLAPIEDSILLRTNPLLFSWTALAELKPGPDEFSRSVSGYEGTLLVFTGSGKVYSMASCKALSRKDAEARILDEFRQSALAGGSAVYLLPLSSRQAGEVLSQGLTRANFPLARLTRSASGLSGAVLLDCGRGMVRRATVFEISGPAAHPRLPHRPEDADIHPLAWEVFDSLGKTTRWPGPDPFSNLLSSMRATRGIPMGERVKGLETTGDEAKVTSVSGEEVTTTRAQLRALVSIYS